MRARSFALAKRFVERAGRHLIAHRECYLVPLGFAVLVSLIYREILDGHLGVGWDLIESYWPDLAFLGREFRHGNVPLWNPTERGGVPTLADPQPALLYPVQWVLALGAALFQGGTVSWGMIQFKELFHHTLAGALTYWYVRTRRMPWQAALLSGVTVIVADVWVQLKSNNFLQAVAWTPLVWIAIDRLLANPTPRRAVALAAALYLPASVGSPPGYWYMLLATVSYALFRIVETLSRRFSGEPHARSEAQRFALRVAGALAIAALLTLATQAILFLPVADLLAVSPRSQRTVDFAVGGESGYAAVLTALVVPMRYTYTIHCGLLAPALALLALVVRPTKDRGGPLFFAGMGFFFLLCAFGPATPVLRFLVLHVPGFGLFRASARYLVPFPLFFGVLAGYGMTVLLEPRSRLRLRVMLVGVVGLAIILVTEVLRRKEPQVLLIPTAPWQPFVCSLLVAGFLVAVILVPRRAVRFLVPAGVLLVSAFAIEVARRDLGYQPRPDHLEDLTKIKDLAGVEQYRIYDEFLLEQRAGSRLGLREFRGYPSEDPLSRVDYQSIISAATQGNALSLLGEYNVRYVLYGPHSTKGWSRRRLPGDPARVDPARFRRVAPRIYELSHPAPQVAWYGAVRSVPRAEVLSALRAARDAAGLRRIAVIASDSPAVSNEPRLATLAQSVNTAPPAVVGQIKTFAPDRVVAEVEAPAEGVVVLNEFIFPGWRVAVDGRPANPITVDLCLRGVLVGKGRHLVEWSYRPPRWPLLAIFWVLGLGTFAVTAFGGAAASWRRRLTPAPMLTSQPVKADTKSLEYSSRLQAFDRGWRRWLDVQRPYRANIRRLDLGFTLDLGCGVGRNLLHLGGRSAGVGVDHAAASVALARQRGLEAYTPDEFRSSAHAVPGHFDSLLVAHVVEHMTSSDARNLICDYLRYVRPTGKVVIIVPQHAGFRSDPTHVEFFGKAELTRLANSCGLVPERFYSFPFPSVVGHVFAHNESILITRIGPEAIGAPEAVPAG